MKTSLEADHLRLIYELGRTFSGKIEFDGGICPGYDRRDSVDRSSVGPRPRPREGVIARESTRVHMAARGHHAAATCGHNLGAARPLVLASVSQCHRMYSRCRILTDGHAARGPPRHAARWLCFFGGC